MIEELKTLIDMIAKVPETALWILLGFAIYKLVTYLSVAGSIVFCIKLGIEKLHDIFRLNTEVKKRPRDVRVDGHFITCDDTFDKFLNLIDRVRLSDKDHGTYLHSFHVDFLRDAFLEYKKTHKLDCHYRSPK